MMHTRLPRRSLLLARVAIIAGFIQITSAGCGEDPELCEEGSLDCACDERSECQNGLICEDEICVLAGGEGGGDAEGSSGAPGSAGAPGGAANPQGDGGAPAGGSSDAGGSVDLPEPDAPQGGMPGAAGQGDTGPGGAPSGGNGGNSSAGSGGSTGGTSAGSGGSTGGNGGDETSPFPGSCSGCYVEFGCFPEHLDCTSDTDCAPCVSTGYSPSHCNANAAFQALLACACASPCESHCSAVCD